MLKAVVAQFDAAELITQRELVSQRVREALIKRASEFHILFDDISITHLTFGKEFTQAVELKQVAQQEAERARFVVEKVFLLSRVDRPAARPWRMRPDTTPARPSRKSWLRLSAPRATRKRPS